MFNVKNDVGRRAAGVELSSIFSPPLMDIKYMKKRH
jgi:hypothetical protein